MHLQEKYAQFFETVIRYLGGLLSAYALSRDPILLARADDLGSALMPVFDTPSGLPAFSVNTDTGKTAHGWTGTSTLWSEVLSCQLEYKYLAYLTGRTHYYTAVEKVMEIMYTANLSSTAGLFPTLWSLQTGLPSSSMSSCPRLLCVRADGMHSKYLRWGVCGQCIRVYAQTVAPLWPHRHQSS
jgi:mannosyl-oligosaccharide alpha-1,2-mannosidase